MDWKSDGRYLRKKLKRRRDWRSRYENTGKFRVENKRTEEKQSEEAKKYEEVSLRKSSSSVKVCLVLEVRKYDKE
jgi:hypothetical protein